MNNGIGWNMFNLHISRLYMQEEATELKSTRDLHIVDSKINLNNKLSKSHEQHILKTWRDTEWIDKVDRTEQAFGPQ